MKTEARLFVNNYAGPFPRTFKTFSTMDEMVFRGTGLRGKIPGKNFLPKNMRYLRLAENKLSGKLHNICYLCCALHVLMLVHYYGTLWYKHCTCAFLPSGLSNRCECQMRWIWFLQSVWKFMSVTPLDALLLHVHIAGLHDSSPAETCVCSTGVLPKSWGQKNAFQKLRRVDLYQNAGLKGKLPAIWARGKSSKMRNAEL